ncbi:MAG: LysE family translocator [Granulosicoccaceae bacterium]
MIDITSYLPEILAAYAILLVAASSPGPAVALLIGIATEQGRTPALIATLGISLGSMTINILTMLGVGIVLSQAAWAVSTLRVIGALYLLYLAYGAFTKAIQPPNLETVESVHRPLSKHFLAGYLLQVTNPKAISFWIAISSIGAVDGAAASVVAIFLVGAFIISFACHGAWAVALSLNAVRFAYVASRRWVEATLGCLFTFFAYKLGTADA